MPIIQPVDKMRCQEDVVLVQQLEHLTQAAVYANVWVEVYDLIVAAYIKKSCNNEWLNSCV